MANMDILEKTEEQVYPFLSFVAEFGGSLGLFLGSLFSRTIKYFDYIVIDGKNNLGTGE